MPPPALPFDPLDLASFRSEWMALLQCASAQCNKEKLVALLNCCDFKLLLSLAVEHGMTGQLALALEGCERSSLPADFVKDLSGRRRTLVIRSLQMTSELFRLLDQFRSEEILALVVKGPVLSQRAYGDPAVRTYADLDLLVLQKDVRRATQCLLTLGFDATVSLAAIDAGRIPGQHFFSKDQPRLLVELHNDRTLRYFPRSIPIHAFFDRRVDVSLDGQPVSALSAEDELVLICVHGAKHFWQRLQWIADVAALLSRRPSMNWDRVLHCARETRSSAMLNAGLQLAATLLQARLPDDMQSRVLSDHDAARLSGSALAWLPFAGAKSVGLLDRAAYRLRMRGNLFSAPAYLLRLAFSPTEDDWTGKAPGIEPFLRSVLGRPLRLIRRYSQR